MANKLTTGLVGHWRLDEGTGTSAADSALSNTGTLVNTPTWDTNVPSVRFTTPNPYCLMFNGTNYVTVPNNASLNFGTGDFSITAWIKTSNKSTQTIVTKRASGGSNEGYMLYTSGNNLLGLLDPGPNEVITSTGVNVTDGSWHFVSLSATRTGNLVLYIDGVFNISAAVVNTGASLTNTNELRMGESQSGFASLPYIGAIDDVRIYNRALTQADVSELFAGSDKLYQSFETQGLVGYWKLDNNALDSSGYGNNGTAVGSPTYTTSAAPTKFVNSHGIGFNGSSQYINLGNTFGGLSAITISTWIKFSVLMIPSTDSLLLQGIIVRGHAMSGSWGLNDWYFGYDPKTNGDWCGLTVIQNGSTGSGVAIANLSTKVIINKWYHVAATWSGPDRTMAIYLNGNLEQGITNAVSSMQNIATGTRIATGTGNVRWFSGSLDDVRIYNRALSADEIALLAAGNRTASVLYSGEWNGATLS